MHLINKYKFLNRFRENLTEFPFFQMKYSKNIAILSTCALNGILETKTSHEDYPFDARYLHLLEIDMSFRWEAE